MTPASSSKKRRNILAALSAAIIVVSIIAILALAVVPQNGDGALQLRLNYVVGEKMTYTTTHTVTNEMMNQSIDIATNPTSANYNSTSTYEVVDFDGETYTLKFTLTSVIQGNDLSLPPITTKVNKAEYYKYLLSSGAPSFFTNVSTNPTLSACLTRSQVNVGEKWDIPVSTGNSSLGLSGQLTLRFAEVKDITVPAGTYRVIRIEVSSSKLTLHTDPAYLDAIPLKLPENMSLQLSGNTYLELGTCRVVKSDLTQETTGDSNGVSGASVIHSERILVEHTK